MDRIYRIAQYNVTSNQRLFWLSYTNNNWTFQNKLGRQHTSSNPDYPIKSRIETFKLELVY